ncbi:MAG: DUF1653 domain-containing protein [Patescibacteria group bacterium]
MQKIKLGKYQHYKGDFYQVLNVARHSETGGDYVVYQALYDDPELGPKPLFVRPLSMFTETVSWQNSTVPRFKFIE